MLKAEQQCQKDRHLVVQSKEWGSDIGVAHEGQVWLEEKGIVIIAD